MIEEKIRNAALAIGTLAGDVKPEHWDLLACIKSEMLDAANQVAILESVLPVELLNNATAQEAVHG